MEKAVGDGGFERGRRIGAVHGLQEEVTEGEPFKLLRRCVCLGKHQLEFIS